MSAEEMPLARIVEAILFASQKPVSAKELVTIVRAAAEAEKENAGVSTYAKVKEADVRAAVGELEQDPALTVRAFEVRETVAGWQLVTRPDFAPWLRQLYPENRSARLSAPALETLAIIAYRQPITRADIEAVRGVAVDGVMQTLLDRGLVRIAGRAEVPGRPLLYETTAFFMEHFGLKNLDDLPNADELRRIALPTATPDPAPESSEASASAPEGTADKPEDAAKTPADATEPTDPPVTAEAEPAGETEPASDDAAPAEPQEEAAAQPES